MPKERPLQWTFEMRNNRSRTDSERGAAVLEGVIAIPVLLLFLLMLIQSMFVVLTWSASTSSLGESARRAVAEQGHNGGSLCLARTRELFHNDMVSSAFVPTGTSSTISASRMQIIFDGKPVIKFQARVDIPCVLCIFPQIRATTLVEVDPYLNCSDV